ncbi:MULTISPECIES: lactonase family protein [Corynebacterium]|jgi:6-phosphogluconolactonase (cycloisomerase 2 family)|uniref:lactonase family protein n=1 Tax=Corynebacterium TaxID=1716 RepID=UPI0008379426|nr:MULTISPECIES: beta-propeller fold lactonase family protein [Corynebacterium]MCI1256902.1 lactonase family protein [Corynebacterium provencense]
MAPRTILIGSRTTAERDGRGSGLTAWHPADPDWAESDRLKLTNPSWITAPGPGPVYVLHGDGGTLSVVEVSPEGHLTRSQTVPAGGRNPVHCARIGGHLLVANYATGTVAAHPVRADGLLEPVSGTVSLGDGVGGDRLSHPHQIIPDGDTGRFLVPDKGLDAVVTLELTADGDLRVLDREATAPGSGPRHGVIVGEQLFVVGELDSSLITLTRDVTGIFRVRDATGTLPEGADATESTAAGIAHFPNRAMLVVSNRGADSLSVFHTGPAAPRLVHTVPCAGRFPRFIVRYPQDHRDGLLVAHEYGDTVSWHSAGDLADGRAGYRTVAHTGSPVCVTPLP